MYFAFFILTHEYRMEFSKNYMTHDIETDQIQKQV